MNRISYWKVGLVLLLGAFPLACAFFLRDRTVEWQEEVPLNTGETIWVSRSTKYSNDITSLKFPFFSFVPTFESSIRFDFKGKSYKYTGLASLMTLAVSPKGIPILLAPAEAHGWGYATKENGKARKPYECTIPFYVQLVPNSDGKSWTWPSSIEVWTYGLPRNLLGMMPTVNQNPGRYSLAQRNSHDLIAVQNNPPMKRIEPLLKAGSCFKPLR
jgi:hypothetical protein